MQCVLVFEELNYCYIKKGEFGIKDDIYSSNTEKKLFKFIFIAFAIFLEKDSSPNSYIILANSFSEY